jgi:hypothetical protein
MYCCFWENDQHVRFSWMMRTCRMRWAKDDSHKDKESKDHEYTLAREVEEDKIQVMPEPRMGGDCVYCDYSPSGDTAISSNPPRGPPPLNKP